MTETVTPDHRVRSAGVGDVGPIIRVLVVDDQELIRSGLALILNSDIGIDVVGQAADGRAAVEQVERLNPDVVLMDVQMAGMDGIEATKRIAQHGRSRVVVLTTFDRDDYLFAALRAGASGFLLKNARAEELIEAVRVVAAGQALLSVAVTERVIRRFSDTAGRAYRPDLVGQMTERELEVLVLLAKGMSNAEIATDLGVSGTTIKTHVSSILTKADVRDRVQAVVLAYESGLVQTGC